MADYTPDFDYEMTSTIVRTVSAYNAKQPVSGSDLVTRVKSAGFKTTERSVREAIKFLRRGGHLICSAPGNNGGYYMARNMDEYQEFKHREMMAKVEDMLETVRKMDKAAANEFGSVQQMGMF